MPLVVTLRPVDPAEYDEFFAALAEYVHELDQYDPTANDDPWYPEIHRAAVLDDMEGRDVLWIEADGARAGFAMVRVYPDFPDDSRDVAEIAEFCVFAAFRGRGIGAGAVSAIIEDHRARGTHSIDASVLRGNEAALRFWERMGFIVRSVDTTLRL